MSIMSVNVVGYKTKQEQELKESNQTKPAKLNRAALNPIKSRPKQPKWNKPNQSNSIQCNPENPEHVLAAERERISTVSKSCTKVLQLDHLHGGETQNSQVHKSYHSAPSLPG